MLVAPSRTKSSTRSNRSARTKIGASGNASWSHNVASKAFIFHCIVGHYNCGRFLYFDGIYHRGSNPRFHKQSMHHAKCLEICEIGLAKRERIEPLAQHIVVEPSRRTPQTTMAFVTIGIRASASFPGFTYILGS
jgi:hypothetical protein